MNIAEVFNQEIIEGSLVCIKTWDEMVHQYGINQYGNIPVKGVFTQEMRYLCGHKYIIKKMIEWDEAFELILIPYKDSPSLDNYLISNEMVVKTVDALQGDQYESF